ncbi:MAG: methicillin resistance protein [Geobacteraceae bacterium GWC2_58_44]|nr:MAG: methicillin resistance protein [Geobacteraceae bacterium GWC2_58_44]HBG07403.1 methicillin resistance protein [Geobacter sp.]
MTRAELKVAVVNPLLSHGWNEMLLSCDNCTIFHSANWARLLAESYGYHPAYFTLSEQERFRGCLPVMEVNSVLTGRRGVCLSFSDYCGALIREPEEFRLLFNGILELGRMSGWRYVEFRGEPFLGAEQPARIYAHHVLQLTEDVGEMHARLRESTARNIRKAEKEGVTVRICRSLQGVQDFYRLHCLTRKRHGVPPQSIRFFEKLHKHVISQELGFTALASHGRRTVAGVICLHFGKNAVYKYGASDETFQQLRANNLVLWEAIKKCAAEGYGSFSLGRTDLDNEGLLAFKNGWGGSRSELNYYRYDFARSAFVPDQERDREMYRNLLRKLPINVLRVLGEIAYRHMG